MKIFNLDSDIIYINHAGVSPWPIKTAEAIQSFAAENALSGPVFYDRWLKTESALKNCCQRLINAPSSNDIALLKNTSEGLSVIAYGLDWNDGDNIVTSKQEFPSNQIVWQSLADKGVELREANVFQSGTSYRADDPEQALFDLVDENTRLLTISSVQYASGLRMDLKRIGEFCHQQDILFCVDAIQSLGALPFDLDEINADFVIADGHKWMMAPEGVALFYCRESVRDELNLNQYGWHMIEKQGDYDERSWQRAQSARRFECGSPNMLGIVGLNASLEMIEMIGINVIESKIIQHTKLLLKELKKITGVELKTKTENSRLSGIVNFTVDNVSAEKIVTHLKDNNIYTAFREKGVRLSPHFYNTENELIEAVKMIKGIVD